MLELKEHFVVDKDGTPVAVQLDIQDYQKLLAQIETARSTGEMMTIDEIRERFRGEWLLVDTIEAPPTSATIRARVLWHGPDRDELQQKDADSNHQATIWYIPAHTPATTGE